MRARTVPISAMIDFFQYIPTYWSKDDHDFRYNDSDNETDRQPLPDTGISLFHEQLPNAAQGPDSPKTYRTIRVSRDLQIWLTEGRDYRSPNKAPDGPDKTMWGKQQREWLKSTLKSSDAKWKLVITPTLLDHSQLRSVGQPEASYAMGQLQAVVHTEST